MENETQKPEKVINEQGLIIVRPEPGSAMNVEKLMNFILFGADHKFFTK